MTSTRLAVFLRTLVFCCLTGLPACSGKDNGSNSPTGPTPPPPPNQDINYTAIGASDAIGVGGSQQCVPFTPCPNGTGYVPLIVRGLSMGRTVTLMNLGIPGAVLSPDIEALGRAHGRPASANFLEREMPFVPRNTTVLTIFAGGNDINVIAAAIDGGAAGTDLRGFIDARVRDFARDYDRLIDGVRDRAPSTRIVVANLPNFAAVPFTAGYSALRKQVMQKISVDLSTVAINVLAARGIPVVDLLCDARSYVTANYSSDGFHPDDSGYRFMADLYLAAITTASYPFPQTSCAQMTVVPPL
jgi:lysophospholipase L1-like esterase